MLFALNRGPVVLEQLRKSRALHIYIPCTPPPMFIKPIDLFFVLPAEKIDVHLTGQIFFHPPDRTTRTRERPSPRDFDAWQRAEWAG